MLKTVPLSPSSAHAKCHKERFETMNVHLETD